MAVLIVDETGFVKKGQVSVGVARQYSVEMLVVAALMLLIAALAMRSRGTSAPPGTGLMPDAALTP
jgi:SRSO17 transposase